MEGNTEDGGRPLDAGSPARGRGARNAARSCRRLATLLSDTGGPAAMGRVVFLDAGGATAMGRGVFLDAGGATAMGRGDGFLSFGGAAWCFIGLRTLLFVAGTAELGG